ARDRPAPVQRIQDALGRPRTKSKSIRVDDQSPGLSDRRRRGHGGVDLGSLAQAPLHLAEGQRASLGENAGVGMTRLRVGGDYEKALQRLRARPARRGARVVKGTPGAAVRRVRVIDSPDAIPAARISQVGFRRMKVCNMLMVRTERTRPRG